MPCVKIEGWYSVWARSHERPDAECKSIHKLLREKTNTLLPSAQSIVKK